MAVEEETVELDAAAGPPGATIRHLLAHASGLNFEGTQTLAEPGQRRIYSNGGFEVLAEEVGRRAGMPFEQYLTEGVLRPLGMKDTRLEADAGAGLVGPLEDMLRLAGELLAPTLVSEETFRLATATVAFPGLDGILPGFGKQEPLDWGLGFELRDHKSPHWTGSQNDPSTFGHFGGSGSFLWVDPRAELACAVLSGRDFDEWAITAWPPFSDAVLDEFSGGT